MRLFLPLLILAAAHAARAHEGHGLPGPSHWHASDALGFVAVVALALGVAWWRGKK